MQTNNINKIHYCVEITTNTPDVTNTEIGLENGVIRYVTDGLDMSSGYTYEDDTPVNNNWYNDIVSKNGFSTLGSSIDIITGGDFAFLGNFKLTLINQTTAGDPYHAALSNTEVSIVGADVKVYVIIDNKLYSRWSGSISGISFNSEQFKFECKDSHNNNNNTIKNETFGMIKQLSLVVDSAGSTDAVWSAPLTRIKNDSPLDDQFDTFNETYYTSMNTEGLSDACGYQFSEYSPWLGDQGPFPVYATINCQAIQTDSEYYQVWVRYPTDVDMDTIKYVGFATTVESNELSPDKYPLVSWERFNDQYGNDMMRLLIKGAFPLTQTDDQFGNYEKIPSQIGAGEDNPDYLDLRSFNGTIVTLFDVGVKIAPGITAENIVSIVDIDGNIVDLSLIVEVDGEFFLPFNVETYKSYNIPYNKIKMYNDNENNFNNSDESKYNISYNESQPISLYKFGSFKYRME